MMEFSKFDRIVLSVCINVGSWCLLGVTHAMMSWR